MCNSHRQDEDHSPHRLCHLRLPIINTDTITTITTSSSSILVM
jgi:hypothetical protein